MKLYRVLERLNQFEKGSFIKIIENLIENSPKSIDKINEILSRSEERDKLKNMEIVNIAEVFNLLENEYKQYLREKIVKPNSQLDLVTDIIIRDGNCIMKYDWFANLYGKVIKEFEEKRDRFCKKYLKEDGESGNSKCRDYMIYKACLNTAFNQENRITADEHSILITLAQKLSLSQEEVKLIKYMIIPLVKQPIEDVIDELKTSGIAFYSKKLNTTFVADEIVSILRKVRGKEVADKFYRRTLKSLSPPQIRRICKSHNLPVKDRNKDKMIKSVIDNGVSFTNVLSEDIYPPKTLLTERKKFVNELCAKKLKINQPIKGIKISDKIDNLIKYFDAIESDEKVSISFDGYDKLLKELSENIESLNIIVREEFELQDCNVLCSDYLIDYNIKPRDVLDIIPENVLTEFCERKDIKTRGDIIRNILEKYKDSENLYLENYEKIGYRDLTTLKKNGLNLSDTDLGTLFEDLTKKIFSNLNFNVDENLRKKLNTSKNKIDIVLNMGNKEVIIVECKTVKEKGYNKFSTVSRQMKSYVNHVQKSDYKVAKVLLIAPTFSDDFINYCRFDYELNLSLIKASSLYNIMKCFKESRLKVFPINLFRKDVVIREEYVIKAIGK